MNPRAGYTPYGPAGVFAIVGPMHFAMRPPYLPCVGLSGDTRSGRPAGGPDTPGASARGAVAMENVGDLTLIHVRSRWGGLPGPLETGSNSGRAPASTSPGGTHGPLAYESWPATHSPPASYNEYPQKPYTS